MPNWLPLRHDRACSAADDRAQDLPGDGAGLVLLRLACLRRAVPQRDVGHLVRHDADHLTLGLRRLDHPAVHVHRAAGQSKGVDLLHVYDLERVPELGVAQLQRESCQRVDHPGLPHKRTPGRRAALASASRLPPPRHARASRRRPGRTCSSAHLRAFGRADWVPNDAPPGRERQAGDGDVRMLMLCSMLICRVRATPWHCKFRGREKRAGRMGCGARLGGRAWGGERRAGTRAEAWAERQWASRFAPGGRL